MMASLRKLIIMRHAERVDFTFGSWIPSCFDEKGNYIRKNLNMPVSLPKRTGGPMDFFKDSPLTRIGLHQATITGEAMKDCTIKFDHVFCSPSLRCIETCTNVLKVFQTDSMNTSHSGCECQKHCRIYQSRRIRVPMVPAQILVASPEGINNAIAFVQSEATSNQDHLKINIEPGLFEWCAWYRNGMPAWMSLQELQNYGFNISLDYKPLIELNVMESCEEYYMRSFLTTSKLLQSYPGNLFFVGHAGTLDTCSRQLTGRPPRAEKELTSFVPRVPYASVCFVEETPDKTWRLINPPFPPLKHCDNLGFDCQILLS